ncbi:DUF6504 family protein [Angustibacter luteus]|uniref:DUF6504 family protein n=1 Tax=Angustibacter luteus TaxID=658456 RepID=A0ABW1J8K0_9ACTN
MRRYDEQIEVRTASPAEGGPGIGPGRPAPPVAFVWRDRLYVVRGVLAHWYERRVWWREAAASALLGLRSEAAGGARGEGVFGGGIAQGAVATVPTDPDERLEPTERQVWRVEAAAGRSSPVGVYDLVHDPSSEPSTGWRLAGIDD